MAVTAGRKKPTTFFLGCGNDLLEWMSPISIRKKKSERKKEKEDFT